MHPIKFSPNSRKTPLRRRPRSSSSWCCAKSSCRSSFVAGKCRAVGGATVFRAFFRSSKLSKSCSFCLKKKSQKHILEFSEITPIFFWFHTCFGLPQQQKNEMGQEDEGSIKKMTSVNLSILGFPTFDGPWEDLSPVICGGCTKKRFQTRRRLQTTTGQADPASNCAKATGHVHHIESEHPTNVMMAHDLAEMELKVERPIMPQIACRPHAV